MDLRKLRKRCEARLQDLPLPRPFDVQAFCHGLASRRGRPIVLQPITVESGPYGLWVAGPTVDVIFYEQETSSLHQNHIIVHELCHLVCEHRPIPLSDAAIAELLCPHLDPVAVRRVLGRSSYATEEECEAEFLASLILDRLDIMPSTRPQPADAATQDVLGRLAVSLEADARV